MGVCEKGRGRTIGGTSTSAISLSGPGHWGRRLLYDFIAQQPHVTQFHTLLHYTRDPITPLSHSTVTSLNRDLIVHRRSK